MPVNVWLITDIAPSDCRVLRRARPVDESDDVGHPSKPENLDIDVGRELARHSEAEVLASP